jgi:hypothetical protein
MTSFMLLLGKHVLFMFCLELQDEERFEHVFHYLYL